MDICVLISTSLHSQGHMWISLSYHGRGLALQLVYFQDQPLAPGIHETETSMGAFLLAENAD